jgi:hypothetical protein
MNAKVGLAIAGAVIVAILAFCVWGFGLYTDEVCVHLKGQPVIVERLGEISTCDARLIETSDIEDFDTFVFALEGAKGKGRAFVQSTSTGEDAAEVYQGILLVMGSEEILVEGRRPPTN